MNAFEKLDDVAVSILTGTVISGLLSAPEYKPHPLNF